MSRFEAGLRRAVAPLAVVAAAWLLGGCSHDYWVDLDLLTDADPSVVVNRDEVRIPLGYAVAVRATPMKEEDRLDADVEVDLESLRGDLLGVDRGVRDREFIVFGASVGQTEIDVSFGGDWVDTLTAIVTEPD
jgi:hypothetical protein